jgi:hypothetical protein
MLEMIDTICLMFSIVIYLRTIIFGVNYIRMPLTPKKHISPVFGKITPKTSPISKSLEEIEKLEFVQRIFRSPTSKKKKGMGGSRRDSRSMLGSRRDLRSKKRRGGQRGRRTRKR